MGAASRHFEFGVIQIKACIDVSYYGVMSSLLMENNWLITLIFFGVRG